MSTTGAHRSMMTTLAPSQVTSDPRVQRPLDKKHVAKIAKDYSANYARMIVSQRDDGSYVVLDGQHTVEAARLVRMDHMPITALVLIGLSLAEEAVVFEECNRHKKKVDAVSLFPIRVTAQEPTALDIKRILDGFRLSVQIGYSDGMVSAIKSVEDVYFARFGGPSKSRKTAVANPQLLTDTITVLSGAWGTKREAFDGLLVKGVGSVLHKHGASIDRARFARVLAKHGTGRSIVGEIRGLQSFSKTTAHSAAVQVLIGIYNKGLPVGRKLQ